MEVEKAPDLECEVSVVIQDNFSEGAVYPLRALVTVAAIAVALLAFVR